MLPWIAAGALAAMMLYTSKKVLPDQLPGGHHLTRPTLPSQMWVDKSENTVLRNDSECCKFTKECCSGRDFRQIDNYMKQTYQAEAATHPGVRLVADMAAA